MSRKTKVAACDGWQRPTHALNFADPESDFNLRGIPCQRKLDQFAQACSVSPLQTLAGRALHQRRQLFEQMVIDGANARVATQFLGRR